MKEYCKDHSIQADKQTAYSFCDICSPLPSCGVTCTVKDGKILQAEGTKGHPGGNGFLCTKGLAVRQYINREDRIRTPLRRRGEKGSTDFVPISWDEAFAEITERLKKIKAEDGASAVAFYSGYSKWYRPYLQRLCYSFGSVNYGSESSTCYSATAMSWSCAVGYDSLRPDRGSCGTFLGWGYNPYHSKNAAGTKKGKEKVIIVDPRITPAVHLEADLHLRLIPGTDGALAHAIARELIVKDQIDHAFVDNRVHGFEEYKEYVMGFTPERAEQITGVPAEQIIEAARIIGENKPLSISHSASAFVHHKNGFQNHRAVHALIALTGSYDVRGGMIPNPDTLAHSRGGFSTNIHAFEFEKYPKDAPLPVGAEKYPFWYDRMKEMQACDLARQIKEGRPYPIRAVIAHGMNYRMFNADTEFLGALQQLEFFVDTDLFLTDSAKLADIVLPACYSFERSELKVYPGGFLQYFAPVMEPVGMADDDIIFELARRLDVDDDLLKEGRDACYRSIFEGMDIDALKADPDHPHKAENVKRVPIGKNPIQTPTGKFELWATVLEPFAKTHLRSADKMGNNCAGEGVADGTAGQNVGEGVASGTAGQNAGESVADEAFTGFHPLPVYVNSLDDAEPAQFPLQLVSGGRLPNALHSRLHDVSWLRSLRPEPMADIHPEDARARGIACGDPIRITTTAGSINVKANITAMVLPGTVFMFHGYREADVNSIIPKDHNDPYSGFPGFRSVRCEVLLANETGEDIPNEKENLREDKPDSLNEKESLREGKPAGFLEYGRSGKRDFGGSVCERFAQTQHPFLHFDSENCTGCGACAVACMDKNDIADGQKAFRSVLKLEEGSFRVIPGEKEERIRHYSVSCMNCADPACMKVCPKGCFYEETIACYNRKNADSISESAGNVRLILYNNENCIGCGLCGRACPFDAISFRPLTSEKSLSEKEGGGNAKKEAKMEKCDGCADRLRAGLPPACARNCPTGALTFLKAK